MSRPASPKPRITLLLFLLPAFLQCCTPYRYGVPEEQWLKMSEAQQQETMRAYNERQRQLEIARAQERERRAREEALRAEQERRAAEERERRIDMIYRGEAGHYGDLLRVTIRDAEVYDKGRDKELEAVSFKIADGETHRIVIGPPGRKNKGPRELLVTYEDGALFVDGDGRGNRHAVRLVYDHSWKRGTSYEISTNGKARLKKAKIEVEIIPPRHGHDRR